LGEGRKRKVFGEGRGRKTALFKERGGFHFLPSRGKGNTQEENPL